MSDQNLTGRRFFCAMVCWTIGAIMGLTVALLAVGLLGLWVLIGAFAGLGATFVTGWLLQVGFCTSAEEIIAKRSQS